MMRVWLRLHKDKVSYWSDIAGSGTRLSCTKKFTFLVTTAGDERDAVVHQEPLTHLHGCQICLPNWVRLAPKWHKSRTF